MRTLGNAALPFAKAAVERRKTANREATRERTGTRLNISANPPEDLRTKTLLSGFKRVGESTNSALTILHQRRFVVNEHLDASPPCGLYHGRVSTLGRGSRNERRKLTGDAAC